jgi:hypothetical protein
MDPTFVSNCHVKFCLGEVSVFYFWGEIATKISAGYWYKLNRLLCIKPII